MPPVLAHSRESYENSHYYIITQEKYKLITAEREMSEGIALALNATFKVCSIFMSQTIIMHENS